MNRSFIRTAAVAFAGTILYEAGYHTAWRFGWHSMAPLCGFAVLAAAWFDVWGLGLWPRLERWLKGDN